MKSWSSSFKVFFERKMLILLFLGFSSGLPLAMTSSTLGYWLETSQISIKQIGAIALIGIFYNIKFLWSPLVDVLKIPFLSEKFGRRRGWILFTQGLLVIATLGIATTAPGEALMPTIIFALAIAFFSATQDIVIDAYRIEILDQDTQAAGSAIYTYGYRIGMLISGGVALKFSEYMAWNEVYIFLAGTIVLGMAATILAVEPKFTRKVKVTSFFHQIQHAVVSPFVDFMTRKGWLLFLIFIVVYKFPAAFLGGGIMSSFYLKMGYTPDEIFWAVKVFGMGATILGLFVGGLLAAKLGLIKALWIDAILQASTNLLFIPIVTHSQDLHLLALAVASENLASAMGTVVLVAFISSLCNKEFSATQYALLSSLAAFGRTLLAANSGWIVADYGWVQFYLITFASGLPALLLIPAISKYLTPPKQVATKRL